MAPAARLSLVGGLPRRFHHRRDRASVHPAAEVPRRFEDRHIAGWNVYHFSRAGVAARAGLTVPDLEGAKASELYTVALGERVLHGVEEGVNHQPAFPLGDSRSDCIDDLLNEVGFGHPLVLDGVVNEGLSPRL